jgi:hypothetical protein
MLFGDPVSTAQAAQTGLAAGIAYDRADEIIGRD